MSSALDFADLPRVPLEHFKLCWFGAVERVIDCAVQTFGPELVKKEFSFVEEYAAQLRARGIGQGGRTAELFSAVEAWEAGATAHLPLRALRLASELGWNAVGALLTAGLHEEDPRFGALFAAMQGGSIRVPTVGFLNSCWGDGQRGPLRQLQEWGLLTVAATTEARHAWPVQVPAWLWDALSSAPDRVVGPGFELLPSAKAPDLDAATAWSHELRSALRSLPALAQSGAVSCVVVRGPQASGRKTLARHLAATLGRGVLSFSPPLTAGDPRWVMAGPLAKVFGALPIAEFELGPGESVNVPELGDLAQPFVLVLGRRGGLSGPGAARTATLELQLPGAESRQTLWRRWLPGAARELHDALAQRYRLPIGRLATLCRQATARAALRGQSAPELADFGACACAMQKEALGTLATPLPDGGGFGDLALQPEMVSELRAVESRCRHRERLALEQHRFAPNVGVRVLLTGPSGTGKTLAARVVAAALGRRVYRVELAAVVNKYIGETEKNLDRVLTLAEDLDALLLFDEGDALMARRTAVQNANDRYANLETNFLLQRLESFEGIVFITTNAGERVDTAFQRRMDAVVELRPPDIDERRRLWELHLPDDNRVGSALLDRLAAQCVLTGGQIRNASVHARLLALNDGSAVGDELLATSVRREYRKLGASCPLRLF